MLAIRNFGHFWSRKHVEWGWQKVTGTLQGYRLVDRKPFIVDFRDQIAVYALFTPSREVVYIGQSGASDQRLFLRLRQHTQNTLRDRWEFFSWFGMRRVNETNRKLSDAQKPDSNCTGSNAEALDEIEAVLLQLFEPRLNKRGPNWGDDTEEYYQYVRSEWEDVPPLMDDTNQLFLDRLENLERLIKKGKG